MFYVAGFKSVTVAAYCLKDFAYRGVLRTPSNIYDGVINR